VRMGHDRSTWLKHGRGGSTAVAAVCPHAPWLSIVSKAVNPRSSSHPGASHKVHVLRQSENGGLADGAQKPRNAWSAGALNQGDGVCAGAAEIDSRASGAHEAPPPIPLPFGRPASHLASRPAGRPSTVNWKCKFRLVKAWRRDFKATSAPHALMVEGCHHPGGGEGLISVISLWGVGIATMRKTQR